MSVHMIKLCVGIETTEELACWHKQRLADLRAAGQKPQLFHATRMVPKRKAEILNGGSLYWVIKGVIQLRQRITGFEDSVREDGKPCVKILLGAKHHLVRPTTRRPFQGWRYLALEDAPADVTGDNAAQLSQLPAKMRKDLAELGLL